MIRERKRSKTKPAYKVGYGKPPLENRFQPGQSGNPKGRPKGHKNLATDLKEVLQERVPVQENGKIRKMTKQRALVVATFNRALKGDPKAVSSIITMMRSLMPQEPVVADDTTEILAGDDLEILEAFAEEVRRQQPVRDKCPEEGDGKSGPRRRTRTVVVEEDET